MVRSHMKARVLWPESPWTSGLWGGSARLQVQTRVHPSTCEDGPRLHVLRPPRELPEDGAKSSRNSFQERVEGAATLFHRDSRHRRLFFFFGAPRGVGRPSTKTLCARPRAQTEFVSNHIWHCHHTVISCPDTNSTATRSWRSNRIFSEPVWRYKGTVTVPLVISICAPLASPPPPSAGKVQS